MLCITVAQDGSGDFASISEAVPSDSKHILSAISV